MSLIFKNKYHDHQRLMVSTFDSIAFVVLVFVVSQINHVNAATAAPSQKTEKLKSLSPEELSQIWTKIKTTSLVGPPKAKEGTIDSWTNVLAVGFKELKKVPMSSNSRQGCEYYVNQFGKFGAQADMRWLIAARVRLLPADPHLNPNSKEKTPELHNAQKYFAEFQVRQFLKKPKLLKRYYHSMIWFNDMFNDLTFPVRLGKLYRNLKEGSHDDNYWWYAQNFVLLAHATGRDDLLKDVKPDNLKPRFQEWFKWLIENGPYLRASPDSFYWVLDEGEKSRKEGYIPFLDKQRFPPLKIRPKYPFPDWKGPKPCTAEEIKQFE